MNIVFSQTHSIFFFTGCSVLKSSYIGSSIDLSRNNVLVVFGDGGPVGAPVSETSEPKMGDILDGGLYGPGGMVAAQLAGVRFEGKEFNRGLKCGRGKEPLVLKTDRGIAFADRNLERDFDKQNQKQRGRRSLNLNHRLTPSLTATEEETQRASKLRSDKKNHREKTVQAVVTKLRGDVCDL